MRSSVQCTVRFCTERRADGGLRIYATDPTGLYVSSKHTYAAAEYFQNYVVIVALNRLRSSASDGGIEMLSGIDWETIVSEGGGTCEFRSIARKDLDDESGPRVARDVSGDFPPLAGEQSDIAQIELHVESRPCAPGKKCVVAHDIGERDPVLEDIIRRQETLQ